MCLVQVWRDENYAPEGLKEQVERQLREEFLALGVGEPLYTARLISRVMAVPGGGKLPPDRPGGGSAAGQPKPGGAGKFDRGGGKQMSSRMVQERVPVGYAAMRELLEPLRFYDLSGGSVVTAELRAYGAALERFLARSRETLDDLFPQTCSLQRRPVGTPAGPAGGPH